MLFRSNKVRILVVIVSSPYSFAFLLLSFYLIAIIASSLNDLVNDSFVDINDFDLDNKGANIVPLVNAASLETIKEEDGLKYSPK